MALQVTIGADTKSAAILEELHGRDLVFGEDLVLTSEGDLAQTRGLEALRQKLARAIAMMPGEIFWTPEVGIGLVGFNNVPASSANFDEIEARVRTELSQDPAVDEVSKAKVFVLGDAEDGTFLVEVSMVIDSQPLNLQLDVRRI